MKKNILLSSFFSLVIIFSGYFLNSFNNSSFLNDKNKAEAAAGEVTGWLWSDNIGWVSLNCSNTATCATSSYAVTQDAAGNWSGYGWSDNAGWLSFGSGCPSGAEGTCGAKMSANELKGWARFTAAKDGWDGWVSFSSENDHDFATAGVQSASSVYGGVYTPIDANQGSVSGYAWGSSVVGWLSFSDVRAAPVVIAGICSSVHYECDIPGTSTNNTQNTDSWTWVCPGSNNGANANCLETNCPVGKTWDAATSSCKVPGDTTPVLPSVPGNGPYSGTVGSVTINGNTIDNSDKIILPYNSIVTLSLIPVSAPTCSCTYHDIVNTNEVSCDWKSTSPSYVYRSPGLKKETFYTVSCPAGSATDKRTIDVVIDKIKTTTVEN